MLPIGSPCAFRDPAYYWKPAFPDPKPSRLHREEVSRALGARVKERATRARARSGPASNRTSD